MTFLHKLIITNKYLRYTPAWWWWRLMSHEGFRLDDRHLYGQFWYSINSGFMNMNYQYEYKNVWGK